MANLTHPVLAVIPARGGSKGLPGKNVRLLGGLPLIVHSLRCAAMTPQIDRCIVSTDDPGIADVARAAGGHVPFLRPAALAGDATPMMPVLQHALRTMEEQDGKRYEILLLLDPTSPGRLPGDITEALAMLANDPAAQGVVSVSEPRFNPRWVCVEPKDGYMAPAFADAATYTRRQDVPPIYRINATLYLWRRDYLLGIEGDHWMTGLQRMLIIPEERAAHIDELADFQHAELALQAGLMQFPWLAP
ncbi:MAG: acylneuraminate cytidylyltransferase family protein [Candidatus Sericytochromatia bacterium]|nr:acylneuraminate cytidylyltransferase family protein [Candidatus Sericytochromatia bacterium]